MADDKCIQQAIDEAVETFIRESGWNESGALTAWVLIGHQVSFDDSGDTVDTYPTIIKGGSQPDHIVIGLLQMFISQMEVEMYRHSRRLDGNEE